MKKQSVKNTVYLLKKAYNYIGINLIFYFLIDMIQDINGILLEVFLVKLVLDMLQDGESFHSVLSILLIFGCYFVVFQFIHNIFMNTVWKSSELKFKLFMNKSFCEKSKDIDTAYFDNTEFYDSYIKAKDVSETRGVDTIQSVSILIKMLVRIFIIVFYISTTNILLMFLVIGVTILSTMLTKKASFLSYKQYLETVKSDKRISYISKIFNQYDNAKDMRMYQKIKNVYLNQYSEESKNKIQVMHKYKNRLFFLRFTVDYIFNSFILRGIIILVAAYLVLVKHLISYGFFATIIPSLMDINDSMSNLAAIIPKIFENSYYIENYRAFMNAESKLHNKSEGLDVPLVPQLIQMHNVSFAYSDELVLKNVSLDIKPCEKIAIVGMNGVGKSTLVKLLMRLYDPAEGYITLGGKNIKDYDVESFYHYFGVVFQDYKMYYLKLAENILMDVSTNEAEKNQAIDALKKLDISYILKRTTKGLDTCISKEFDKNGILLSGGESQKLAISRAFSKDFPVLIMDEPSSALDPISEFKLNKLLIEQSNDKTIIFISHRLSTTRNADRIVLLGKEGIVEQGNHDELMVLNGIYADMFNQQASSYRKKMLQA